MLHIVSRLHSLEILSRYVSSKDTLLLVEEAVYATNPKHRKHVILPSIKIKALEPDITARGLSSVCASHIEAVDFAGFVDLTAEHSKSITW
ncbi:multidrug MFS transporter [Vibrio inusitatus NBRC 102082]|uniref:Multidrug MFS transporter n=1 Tax=Vibrio inusitatus NBRC 102082 TaxID=1219070 RepID=A0A4Y3HWI5_9VIBR|nr:sulfurtransferase complex subunit TusB [Vibrio inusitatus]GEA51378.1 multidrug MFS transporter [Vibrio inusitatus NBRC 102082]